MTPQERQLRSQLRETEGMLYSRQLEAINAATQRDQAEAIQRQTQAAYEQTVEVLGTVLGAVDGVYEDLPPDVKGVFNGVDSDRYPLA